MRAHHALSDTLPSTHALLSADSCGAEDDLVTVDSELHTSAELKLSEIAGLVTGADEDDDDSANDSTQRTVESRTDAEAREAIHVMTDFLLTRMRTTDTLLDDVEKLELYIDSDA